MLSRCAVNVEEDNSGMATAVLIPMAEYLHTSYRPDRDYVDGEVQERNLGEQWHAAVQMQLGYLFLQNRTAWGFRALPEQRVRVSPERVRIPDLCLVPTTEPFTGVLRRPPSLCIEVLSPEDRFRRVLERVRDYLHMGVPAVWIINPRSRDIWTVGQDGKPVLHEENALTLEGTAIQIRVADIFALIDEAPPSIDEDSE